MRKTYLLFEVLVKDVFCIIFCWKGMSNLLLLICTCD